jgi:hypothetical protein
VPDTFFVFFVSTVPDTFFGVTPFLGVFVFLGPEKINGA